MTDTAPAFKNQLLFSSEKGISGKGGNPILSLLHLCEVLPGTDGNSESVVINLLLEESIQAALLLSFLVL